MTEELLENVLVTGGCSFIGWHLTSALLTQEPTCKISVFDLPTSLPLYPSITYHSIPITDQAAIQSALVEIRPKVIFHAACTYSLSLPAATFTAINYEGTRNVLESISALPKGTVKALIYHSFSSIIDDGYSDLLNASETKPVLFYPEQRFPYPLSKALAEKAVLDTNSREQGGMLTASIRPAGTFGEGDGETMAKLLETAKSGRAGLQIGDGSNIYDFLYVGNLVEVHLLAAKALLRDMRSIERGEVIEEVMRVDGEVFHVTNDEPWLFWEFSRRVAREVGCEVKKEDIKVMPRWVGMLMAGLAEWWVWGVSFGGRESGLTRYGVRYSCIMRTLNIEKVKKRLGYEPVYSMTEGIKRSVEWLRENGKLN